MIIHVLVDGSVKLGELDRFHELRVEITDTVSAANDGRAIAGGLVRLDGASVARVSVAGLRGGEAHRSDPDWCGRVETLVAESRRRGSLDESTGEIVSPVAWIRRDRRQRTVHGVSLGILMLDTGFGRLPGDVGNASTWPFPVQYAVVRGATSRRIVARSIDPDMLDRFVDAAMDLVRLGVDGITTSCGFLALLHPQLRERIPVPVATSSLLQIPMVQQVLPAGKRVGILTMSEDSLTPEHFRAVGAPTDLPVAGIPFDSAFRQGQLNNRAHVPLADNEAEMIAAARRLLDRNPDVGAFVLECTNMPPYSARLQDEFGLPVYDIYTMVSWFHAGLRPRRHV